VLILDEPASDLDPRARIEIRDLLVELRAMGKTIFLSSHILTELADVCTSVAILERGKLIVAGPITQIARRLETAQSTAPSPAGDTEPADAGGLTAAAAPQDTPAPATRSVRVRAMAPFEAVYAALVSLAGVRGVSPGPGGTVTVQYEGDDHLVAAMVRALVAANVPVIGVEPERNELERIFLEVTKGEVQ
jgi:ABC-2 type transport system ATP-binding protein